MKGIIIMYPTMSLMNFKGLEFTYDESTENVIDTGSYLKIIKRPYHGKN